MDYLFIHYPGCSSCRNAKKWLDAHNVSYTARHIVEQRPSETELKLWISRSGLLVRKFFNTSGTAYKAMSLKSRLPHMSEDEQISLLASDGMLVKRPLLIGRETVLVGFSADGWEIVIK